MATPRKGLLTRCATCGRKTAHENVHQEKGLRHLRCETCRFIEIFASETDVETSGAPAPLEFDEVVKQLNSQVVSTYDAGDAFFVSDLISHSKFSLGYVVAIQEPAKKMEILFEDKRRILLCGPGSGVVVVAEKAPSLRKTPRPARAKRKPANADSSSGLDTTRTSGTEVSAPCPKCGFTSHPFNLRRNPADEIVGCMRCL